MSFIQWLGEWLRKVSTSVKSITAGTNSLTYTRHNNDSVTIPLTLESDLYVKKTGDTVTGNINSLYGVDGTEPVNQFSGEMAGDDLWAIRTGVTGRPDPEGAATGDNGYLEIATADNGTEPIYIAQYEGDHFLPDSQGVRFYRQIRRATLLDEQGNTFFPGTVTATSFNGTATRANYATNAGTAAKLGTSDVGSATQPIYLEGGVATACTYQLYKTVPADAVFTDTVYTHPTTSGNKHIPSGGSSGQILRWSADGTAEWGSDNNTTYSDATQSAHGLMSVNDKKKLDGITAGAEPNQNAFASVLVGNTNVAADVESDTLTLVAGSNITLTADATNDKITIAAKDTVTTVSTTGNGNAITSITANNGALTVKKDSTFLLANANAVSASKLNTPRTISAGDLEYEGSASFDGSQNVNLNIVPYNAKVTIGNTNNYPYHYIGTSGVITGGYSDFCVTLLITRDFINAGYGICRIEGRTNNVSGGAVATCSVNWLVRDKNFPVDAIQVGFRNTSGDTIFDIFYKSSDGYSSIVARVLANGSRGAISRRFELVDSSEVSNTTTTMMPLVICIQVNRTRQQLLLLMTALFKVRIL